MIAIHGSSLRVEMLVPLMLLLGISVLASCTADVGGEGAEGRVVSFDWNLVEGATLLDVETDDGQILEVAVPDDLKLDLGRHLTQEGGVPAGEDRVRIERPTDHDPWVFVSLIEPSEEP